MESDMLEIKIDLIPFGNKDGRKRIHSIILWNVRHSGPDGQCFYKAVFFDEHYEPAGYAETHHIRSDGALILVSKLVSNKVDEIPDTVPIRAIMYYQREEI